MATFKVLLVLETLPEAVKYYAVEVNKADAKVLIKAHGSFLGGTDVKDDVSEAILNIIAACTKDKSVYADEPTVEPHWNNKPWYDCELDISEIHHIPSSRLVVTGSFL